MAKDPLESLRSSIREELERGGGTIAGLARDAKVSRDKVSRFLSGTHAITTTTLSALLAVLELEAVARPTAQGRKDARGTYHD